MNTTGKELAESFVGNHRTSDKCPACDAPISKVAITKLLYQYEPCDCSEYDYTHLVEKIYHRTCYGQQPTTPPDDGGQNQPPPTSTEP